jgi:hypothetical protein
MHRQAIATVVATAVHTIKKKITLIWTLVTSRLPTIATAAIVMEVIHLFNNNNINSIIVRI